jgi:hypothetical protein
LSEGTVTETIELTDAHITSYQLVPGSTSTGPSISLNLIGRPEGLGSIFATIDGTTSELTSVTIPQSNSSRRSEFSLVANASEAFTNRLTQLSGETIPEVSIAFGQLGHSAESIMLQEVSILSVRHVGTGDKNPLEVTINLVAVQETQIRRHRRRFQKLTSHAGTRQRLDFHPTSSSPGFGWCCPSEVMGRAAGALSILAGIAVIGLSDFGP